MKLALYSLWHWMVMLKGLKGSLLTYSALFIKLFCVMKFLNTFWGRSKAGDTACFLSSCSALRHFCSSQRKYYTCVYFSFTKFEIIPKLNYVLLRKPSIHPSVNYFVEWKDAPLIKVFRLDKTDSALVIISWEDRWGLCIAFSGPLS